MKNHVAVLSAILVLASILAVAPSVSAFCGDCGWTYGVEKANQYAQFGIDNDTGCSWPWSGGEYVIGWLLGQALDDGEDAVDLLLQAESTCSCSTARAAKDKLIEARDHAQDAVNTCDPVYCDGNQACTYANNALTWYNVALAAVESCITQACGAAS